jgi:FtsP/CotA-like multicopper oxidase with cupredoxin domain
LTAAAEFRVSPFTWTGSAWCFSYHEPGIRSPPLAHQAAATLALPNVEKRLQQRNRKIHRLKLKRPSLGHEVASNRSNVIVAFTLTFNIHKRLSTGKKTRKNPVLGSIEISEIYNFTQDAHPIHIHEVQFQVVNRQPFDADFEEPCGESRGSVGSIRESHPCARADRHGHLHNGRARL